MKILNLYAGIGGNRKLWEDVQVTAVEIDPEIAEIYSGFYPADTVIVDDAHQYLLEHYKEFDFIWSSPPCPSHSRIREAAALHGRYPAIYPDPTLWQEITLLEHFCRTKWVVENVNIYYEPVIEPAFKLDRHLFWSNFYAAPRDFKPREVAHKYINGSNHKIFGVDLSGFNISDKRRVLRNMVNPEVGEYILNVAMDWEIKRTQMEMF